MEKIKISVIIPAYNAEQTLTRCINSVLSQTFQNFELIIVDDGSTDGTRLLCDDYVRRDRRINVIHQTNHGLIFSRESGLKRATGQYVLQVDADDWLEPDMLKLMFDKAKETDADMVICDFTEHQVDKVLTFEECPPPST